MTLLIGILGRFVLESDCSLGKVPKKARALVAYLAAHGGQPVSRERLADLLWPHQRSEQAPHELSPNFGDGLKDQAAAWA